MQRFPKRQRRKEDREDDKNYLIHTTQAIAVRAFGNTESGPCQPQKRGERRATRSQCATHCAGIVISGRFSFSPVSASVKSIIMNEKMRLDFRSRSSIQN